jgi:hypothetical protein
MEFWLLLGRLPSSPHGSAAVTMLLSSAIDVYLVVSDLRLLRSKKKFSVFIQVTC